MSNSKKVTVSVLGSEYGEQNFERVSLPKSIYESSKSGPEDFTGVWITGIWAGKISGRFFARTYSIWQSDNSGRCVGETYRELSKSDFLSYCKKTGTQVPDWVPAIEI